MRIKRLALVTGVLLVAALVASVIGAHLFAPRVLAALAETIKAKTGRELSFGEVRLRVLPHPILVVRQARFGNAAWGSQPWLVQTGSVSVDVDMLRLFSGRLHVRRVAAADVSVLLETDADGNGNWVVGTSQSGARTPTWLDTLEFDELSLQDVALRYHDRTTGKTTLLHLDRLDVAGPSASHPIHFSAGTTLDGNKLTATGTIGALSALIANSPAYPVDLEGGIGAAAVTVHGTIDKPRRLDGLNLALRVQAPDLADVAAAFGANVPRGPFRGAAQLTGAVTAPVFSAVDLELGTAQHTHLTARGELQGSVGDDGACQWRSPGIDLAVEGGEFGDLSDWTGRPLPALGRYHIAAHAAGPLSALALSAIDAAAGGGEMPQINLSGAVADAQAASGIDLKIAATAADWWHAGAADAAALPPFRASARVRDARDGYRIDDLDLRIAGSRVSASLQVVKTGSRLRVTGSAKSPLIDLAHRAPARGSGAVPAKSEAPARDYWKLADLDLDLNIRRLVLPDGRPIDEGSGRIALVDGHLQASALQGTFAGAKIHVDGGISDLRKLAGLDLKIALQGNELADLFKSFGKIIPPVGPYQGRAELRGSQAMLLITNIDASAGRHGQNFQVSGQIDDALNWSGLQLAIDANIGDSPAAGRLFGVALPRLPAWQGHARIAGPQGGYVFDDLDLELGRSLLHGRVAFMPGEPRPRVTATLGGPMLDLSALPPAQRQSGGSNPLLAVDVDADVRFDHVVLPDRRALGPVNGGIRLDAGALQLKQFSISVDGASATIDGSIDDPTKPAGLALMVNAKVSRGTGMAEFTGQRIPDELPQFSVNGRLSDVSDGYALTGLELAFAAAKVTGEVSLLRGPKRYMLRATASSPMLDVSGLSGPRPAETAAKPAAAGARAIPDVALPLDVLRAFDADLDLRVDTLTFRDATSLGPLQVRATIADGRLTAEPVQLDMGTGQALRASATVDAGQSAWTLRLDGSGINLGEMFARFGLPQALTGGSAELGLELRAHGKSLRALVSSLNGTSLLKVGPMRVNNFAVGLGEGIVARLFSMANPFQKTDADTEVKCAAGRLQIADGVVTSPHNVAVETEKYNLLMSGTVNLRTEGLDVVVTPVVTSGLVVGDISTIVRLGGTLAAPTVGLTAAGAVKSVASLGATLTVPGVGQLVGSLFKKAINDPHPCTTALAQGTDGNQ